MAIIATCLCGAQFKVAEDTAGEQMTCPMCATMVLVPSLDIAQIEDAEKKAKPKPMPCSECEQVFPQDEMVNQDGVWTCRRCYHYGPRNTEMSVRTKKLLLIVIGAIAIIIVNIFLAYLLFGG